MKIACEMVGIFIISLVMVAIPILCPLSFVYNWFVGLKFILSVACFLEWIGLMNLLADAMDKKD